MSSVIVVGSLNADLVVRVPHIPVPGETILGSDFVTVPGGKGANQAVAAVRMGAAVSMVGRVGGDGQGEMLRRSLAADGVNEDWLRTDDDSPTGIAMIEVSDDGQNTIVVAPGANHRLTPADIESARGVFAGASILLLQLEIPLETVIAAARMAREHGVKVLLNPAPAQPLPAELLALVDILIPNETEAAMLTASQNDPAGENPANESAALLSAKQLSAQGIETVIVTLGARGCLLVDSSGWQSFPAYAVRAVDTTAAGDAFIGAFAAAAAEGKNTIEAVAWGSAAGALAATKPGAQPSLPSRAEVMDFLERQS
jgi:ribokinase